jgi:glycogen synthase
VLERVIHAAPPDAARFAAVERAPAERVEIAFVGRVEERKGADVAAAAVRRLRSDHDIDAVLRAAGPIDPAVGSLADRGDVELLGPLPGADVAAVLARAHALVVPSVWEEPLGLAAIEGAFARVPVVASRVGGLPEALSDEEHALLVAPGEPAALAAALARTLREPEATAARVERARAHVAERFDPERYLAESERFVEDAATALR